MRNHIDWLTFTMPMVYGLDTPDAYAKAIASGFLDMFGEEIRANVFGGEWRRLERGRAPYSDAWQLADKGLSLFASPTLSHCCVEISGAGCELLIKETNMDMVLQHCRERITRIDIASDITCDVHPIDFVGNTTHERMRTSGHYISETGETCYVGSQKSERFARVYRYNSPHPRSELLRVEHVFRRDAAKAVANAYVASGVDAVALSAGVAFGWSSPVWDAQGDAPPNISVVTATHKGNNTVFWLVDTVAPCFQRLVRDGVIKDAEGFIRRYFLNGD